MNKDLVRDIMDGNHISDADLAKAIEWFDDLQEKLDMMGPTYGLARQDVSRTRLKLSDMKFWRDIEKHGQKGRRRTKVKSKPRKKPNIHTSDCITTQYGWECGSGCEYRNED